LPPRLSPVCDPAHPLRAQTNGGTMMTISRAARSRERHGRPTAMAVLAIALLLGARAPAVASDRRWPPAVAAAAPAPAVPRAGVPPRAVGAALATARQDNAREEAMDAWVAAREAWAWVLCFDDGASCAAQLARRRPIWAAWAWT